jgi:hypothetical protein
MSTGSLPKTIQRLDALEKGLEELKISSGFRPGEIILTSLSVIELRFGFYHANGDKYGVDTPQGAVLAGLSTEIKTRWRITTSAGQVNLPNYYHTDGRPFFPRAGTIPGVVQTDAIRNIKTTASNVRVSRTSDYTDSKNPLCDKSDQIWTSYSQQQIQQSGFSIINLYFDASKSGVPTADENRSLNISMTPAVYLGV